MNYFVIFCWSLFMACVSVGTASGGPMDELVDQFDNEYEAMIPAPNSSVGTDYPIRQVALGTYYTNQSLRLLYDQNQLLLERQEELIEKYDRMIMLNERMVNLLTRIAEQTELMPEPVEGNP